MTLFGLRSTCALVCFLVLGAAQAAQVSLAAPSASAATSLSTYRAYASAQSELLVRMTRMLARDIKDGNVEAAQNDYATTRRYLERIRPVLALQRDLERSMDAVAEDYRGNAADPDFSGFHRIEHDLFALRTTQGLSVYADRLNVDAVQLHKAIATQPMSFNVVADGPASLVEAVSARVLAGGREPYAKTDLWDIEANIDGARAIVAAIKPQIEARDPLLMPRLSAAFADAAARLSDLRDGCGFKSYDLLTSAEKARLQQSTKALAREIAKLKDMAAID